MTGALSALWECVSLLLGLIAAIGVTAIYALVIYAIWKGFC